MSECWLIEAGKLEPQRGTVELGSTPPASYADMMAALKVQYGSKKFQIYKHGSRHWVRRLA